MSTDLKTIVKEGEERAFKDITERVSKLGFVRTKKRYWVRIRKYSIDFIILHRDGISYGGGFLNHSISLTVQYGNRELNDREDFIVLNGPDATPDVYRKGRFHHRFNAKSGSTYERCLDDLERFVKEVCEPWFISINVDEIKLVPENVNQSYKLLGIKEKHIILSSRALR